MQTGENEQALRKIIDFTRLISIAILIIHFYLSCYPAFQVIGLTKPLVNHILLPLSKMIIFARVLYAKLAALILLMISLIGSKGKKDESIKSSRIFIYCLTGLIIIFYQYAIPCNSFSCNNDSSIIYRIYCHWLYATAFRCQSAFQDA
jgi:general stress protein CsbA